MGFEQSSSEALESSCEVKLKGEYEALVPEEFKRSPFLYFESHGIPVKKGEIKRDDKGRVKEDPTAVRYFPEWKDGERSLLVVAKKVNDKKGMLAETGEPLYEYNLLEYMCSLDLPVPKPVGYAEGERGAIFLMEKVKGLPWSELQRLQEKGWTQNELGTLLSNARERMEELAKRFEQYNIKRSWKLKDMVFEVDQENHRLNGLIPTDFERTRVVPQE